MLSIRKNLYKNYLIKKHNIKYFASGKVKKIDPNLKEFDFVAVGGIVSGSVIKYLQHIDFKGTMAGFNPNLSFYNQQHYEYIISGHMKGFKYSANSFGDTFDSDISAYYSSRIVDIKPEKNELIDNNGATYKYKSLLLDVGLDQKPQNMPFLKKFINDNSYAESRVFVHAPSDQFQIERNRRIFQMHKDNDFIVYLPEFPSRREAYDAWYLSLDHYFNYGIQSGTFTRNMKVRIITPNKVLFRYPFANEIIMEECSQRTTIETHFGYKLKDIEIVNKSYNSIARYATFVCTDTGKEMRLQFGSILVTPQNEKRELFKNNDIANENGEVTVNPYTLQHTKYSNIFAIGDATNVNTTKSLYATLNQSTVVRNSISDYLNGNEFKAIYKGYSAFFVNHTIDRQWVFSHYYNWNPALLNFYVPRVFGLFMYCLRPSFEKQYFQKLFQKKGNFSYPFVMKNKYFRPLDENKYLQKNNIKKEDILIHQSSYEPPMLSHN